MRKVSVTLNGKTIQVEELRRRANQAWRERLEAEFQEIAGVLEGAGNIELTDGAQIAGLVRTMAGKVIGSVDIIAGLLGEYAPELAAELDEAYDSEVLDAFTAVLGLAYPFGGLWAALRKIGSAAPPIAPS